MLVSTFSTTRRLKYNVNKTYGEKKCRTLKKPYLREWNRGGDHSTAAEDDRISSHSTASMSNVQICVYIKWLAWWGVHMTPLARHTDFPTRSLRNAILVNKPLSLPTPIPPTSTLYEISVSETWYGSPVCFSKRKNLATIFIPVLGAEDLGPKINLWRQNTQQLSVPLPTHGDSYKVKCDP